jgi:hypothetical protein
MEAKIRLIESKLEARDQQHVSHLCHRRFDLVFSDHNYHYDR